MSLRLLLPLLLLTGQAAAQSYRNQSTATAADVPASAGATLHKLLLSMAAFSIPNARLPPVDIDVKLLTASFNSVADMRRRLPALSTSSRVSFRAMQIARVQLMRHPQMRDECVPIVDDGGDYELCTLRLIVACVWISERNLPQVLIIRAESKRCFWSDKPDTVSYPEWKAVLSSNMRQAVVNKMLTKLGMQRNSLINKDSSERKRRSTRSIDANRDLKSGVRKFVSKFAWLQQLVTSSQPSPPIRRITSRGFTSFSQTAALQAVESVEPSRLSEFGDYLLESLDVSAEWRPKIKGAVFDFLPFVSDTEWHDFKIIFESSVGGKSKYVNILAHKSNEGYDFVIADFQTTFTLAPRLIVVEKSSSKLWGAYGSSETVIKRIPETISDEDLDVLMTFFDLAAFRRFAEMLQVPLYRRSRRMAEAGWMAGINAGIETYSKFAKAFATTKTSTIVGKIIGKGFDHFGMTSRVHVISSLSASYLDRYLKVIDRLYDLPKKYLPEIKIVLEIVRFSGHQDWNKNDFLFDIGRRGRNNWVTILTNRNADGTFNFLIANVKQTFSLAPNILIIKESKSVAGGIYQSEKYKFKRIPRGLTEADIHALTNFFNIITFKRFGLKFNVDTSELDP